MQLERERADLLGKREFDEVVNVLCRRIERDQCRAEPGIVDLEIGAERRAPEGLRVVLRRAADRDKSI